jgi:hypothetical protein
MAYKCILMQNKVSDISKSLYVISSTVNYLSVTKKHKQKQKKKERA